MFGPTSEGESYVFTDSVERNLIWIHVWPKMKGNLNFLLFTGFSSPQFSVGGQFRYHGGDFMGERSGYYGGDHFVVQCNQCRTGQSSP